VGQNLSRLGGALATASSEYGGTWTIARGADNDLTTSWFTTVNDCATDPVCTKVPMFTVTFPSAQTVSRIALRGNREYAGGYDFMRGKFEILGAGDAVLWSASLAIPEPDRDLDIFVPAPVANATAVRFTSEQDESVDPGFGELEAF
jgi:hypothetical protein